MKTTAIILFLCSLLISCTMFRAPDVIVLDNNGKPIEGAKIFPISLSINYPSVKTDLQGRAWISYKIQKTKWLTISKSTYKDIQVNFEQTKPIIIYMEKAETAKKEIYFNIADEEKR